MYLLQSIPKSKRLPIRNIIIILSPQLNLPHPCRQALPINITRHFPTSNDSTSTSTSLHALVPFSLRIQPLQVEPQSNRKSHNEAVADQNRTERHIIMRRILRAKELGPSHITSTVRNKQHRCHNVNHHRAGQPTELVSRIY